MSPDQSGLIEFLQRGLNVSHVSGFRPKNVIQSFPYGPRAIFRYSIQVVVGQAYQSTKQMTPVPFGFRQFALYVGVIGL